MQAPGTAPDGLGLEPCVAARCHADHRAAGVFGLPTASTCYVLASRMGYNGPYVAALVTLSTLSGMLSLPFALGVLR